SDLNQERVARRDFLRVAGGGAALLAATGKALGQDSAQSPAGLQVVPQQPQPTTSEEADVAFLLGGITIPLASMRVHGTSASVEFPDVGADGNPAFHGIDEALRRGWGTIVQAYRSLVWVHFSIPSPVPLEPGKALLVTKVYILFDSQEPVIRHVHLWD